MGINIIELAPDLLPERLHSSVGRASHRYRRGHGFESRWSLEFILGFICNCFSYFTTAKISFTSILYLQFTHIMIFITQTVLLLLLLFQDTHQVEGERTGEEESMANEMADKLDKLMVIFFTILHEDCHTDGGYWG